MKLCLIAMSGVRANNPDLTALGLTLPGFVERSHVVASLPSLGLLTLAAMTPQAIDTSYVEVPNLAQVPDLPAECDVAAISSYTAQIRDAYALADRYRAAGTQVILGGLHVTALPEEALEHADAVAVGEGEAVWPEIVSDLLGGNGRLQRIYDGRSRAFDLREALVPRYELLDVDRYNRLTVQTQRGCPFRCEFCAASIQMSPAFKQKPVENVIAEIRRIRSIWPRPFIEFADDNTFVNKPHSKRLLRALSAEHVRWFTETDLSVADDNELLGLMRDSGCAQILIGFESVAFSELDGIELRSNWKARQLDRYAQAIDRIQALGIAVNGCFILGLDGAGPESFDRIWRFVRDSGLYDVQITVQTAFPGTPLYARLERQGRMLRQRAWELCTLFDVNFLPANMSVADLEAGLRNLGQRLYSEEFTRGRRARFLARRRQHLALERTPMKGSSA
jgi:radical SAM superfamily enzyme YgiQ (UPF0313 family)